MRNCPYALAVGSLMFAMFCTRSDICYAVNIVSRYQSNPSPEYWTAVKHILKYLNKTKHYFLMFGSEDTIFKGIQIQISNQILMIENQFLDLYSLLARVQ